MTRKETEILITKYLNGETTMEEEKRLALEVMRDNAPEEWKIIAAMLGELATDEALFDHIMAERATQRFALKPSPQNWWWAVAACLLLGLGIFSWFYNVGRVGDYSLIAKVPDTETSAPRTHVGQIVTPAATMVSETYQDPALVTQFIGKLAKTFRADSLRLDCTESENPTVWESVYLFADNEEQNIIGRLMQVACWYSNRQPGYHLTLNDKQFIFQLEDNRKNIHYQWMAERVRGRILLHCSHTTASSSAFSACYREFKNEIEDNPCIINNHKTVEI